MRKHKNNFKYNKNTRNNKYKKKKRPHKRDGIQARFLEVTAEQCRGDIRKMIKKFSRKVRKEEVLKPFYGKLAYHQTKGQLERQKKSKGKYLFQKREKKRLEEEKNSIFEEKVEF